MLAGLAVREARWLIDEYTSDAGIDVIAVHSGAARRLGGEPLQYVLGHWPFRSLDLDVDARVLIPRPETEELVGVAMAELARTGLRAPVVVDLGCGSGAIGLALVHELLERGVRATLICVDASHDALDLAKHNARKHAIEDVSFVHSSWFDDVDESLRGRVDLIVANPPYVGERELLELDPVLRYEPYAALVSSDSSDVVGFADLELIINESPQWLSDQGRLICEHGATQRDAVVRSARGAGFASVHVYDDVAGLARIVVARRA